MILSLFKRVSLRHMNHIQYLTFYYSTGNRQDASVDYALTTEENGRYTVKIIPDGVKEKDAFVTEVDECFADKVLAVLKQYCVGRWNGFDRIEKRILDGRSFTLNVGFLSGKSIHAHGYMCWPKNYREVKEALNAAFMPLYRGGAVEEPPSASV